MQTLEVDVTALQLLPETDPVGPGDMEVGLGGCRKHRKGRARKSINQTVIIVCGVTCVGTVIQGAFIG